MEEVLAFGESMSELPKLKNAPIIEAVLDIDCAMPSALELMTLEKAARDCFCDTYPVFETQYLDEHEIEPIADGAAKVSSRHSAQALQFFQVDKKQIVQVRRQGFSFNRLAPYTSLDDYLPEMERTWRLFIKIASPKKINLVRLRYVNKIWIPLKEGRTELEEWLKYGPRLPEEEKLDLLGFLNQYIAIEKGTGNQVVVVLTPQAVENGKVPIIFDNTAISSGLEEPNDWPAILKRIHKLRDLKNRIFRDMLTEKCVKLFQE